MEIERRRERYFHFVLLYVCWLKDSLGESSTSVSTQKTICPYYVETRPAGNIYIENVCFKVAKVTSSKHGKNKTKQNLTSRLLLLSVKHVKGEIEKRKTNLQNDTKCQVWHKSKLSALTGTGRIF